MNFKQRKLRHKNNCTNANNEKYHLNFKYYNNKDVQDINSSSCSYYCICFIKFMNSHPNNPKKAFDTFIQLFSNDTSKNESILYNILYN